MRDFEIIIHPNEDGRCVYFPGDVVHITVLLTLDETKEFNNSYFAQFRGRAYCCWTEGRYASEGKEDLIDFMIPFIHKNSILNAGRHAFNVDCKLPSSIPESFKGNIGEIYYEILIVHEKFLNFGEKTESVGFIVERHDSSQLTREPILVEKLTKFITFSCFNNCKIKIELPRGREYTSGETIPIKISLGNQSSVELRRVVIKLWKFVSYKSSNILFEHQTEEKEEIVSMQRNLNENEIEVTLELPFQMAKSNRAFCSIVVVSYALKFEFEVDSFHRNPKIEIPISIGEEFLRVNRVNKKCSKYCSNILLFIFGTIFIIFILLKMRI